MRESLSAIHYYGREYIYISPSPSPSPSPAPAPSSYEEDVNPFLDYLSDSIPLINTTVDFATLLVITSILFLSIVSLSLIFHLRLRSRCAQHLQNFNALWTVRVLLVLFVSGWAVNEILRLPLFHRRLHPSFNLTEQADLCKTHVVLSLGLFEPGFLVTLLFLINVSVKQRNPGEICSLFSILLMSVPTLLLQIIFVFFTPLEDLLPLFMIRTSLLSVHGGDEVMVCTYPLLSSIVFGAFAVVYSMGLLLSCWRVVLVVINKNIKVRINMLGMTVMMGLSIQMVFMAAAAFWTPGDMAFGGVLLVMFVSVAVCAAAGEVILVIKPILEALATGGECCEWNPRVRLRQSAENDSV